MTANGIYSSYIVNEIQSVSLKQTARFPVIPPLRAGPERQASEPY